jgi:phosphatidylglycerol:prolipoprotein diacylglycerol transferase
MNILAAINKIAFTIGSLEVRWYGIIIITAMIFGLIYISFESKRINLSSDDAIELFLWIIPLAIIFGRMMYVLPRADRYFPWESWQDFVDAIAVWDGGITIIGGILGGLIGVVIFTYRKRKKTNFGQVVDLVIPALLFGQIVGRLGNFINQEAFGVRIENAAYQKFPFAVYIDSPSGVELTDKYTGTGWYAATFFYEMVWNSIGLAACLLVWRKNKKYPGLLGFIYFFWYFLGRGLLEFIRLDAVPVTRTLSFVIAPMALVAGALYMAARSSQLSFKKVNDAIKANVLTVTELTPYDVKNYKFAGKILSESKNPLRFLYRVGDFEFKDIDALDYIEAPKKAKKSKSKA